MVMSNMPFTTPFETCLAWGSGEGQVIASYKVEPEIERANGDVKGRVVEFIRCRIITIKENIGIVEDTLHYDLDSIRSPNVRDQVQRLIGQSLDLYRGGGAHYINRPHVGLKLNKISDQIAEREIKDNLDSIPHWIAGLKVPVDTFDKLRHLAKLAELNFETGALLYQQEAQKEEVISHLRSAAEYYFKFISARGGPEMIGEAPRFVGDFEKAVELVVCFGEKGLRRELAGIERWQYYFPEDDEYRTRADYLEVEKRFVAEGVLNEAELLRLEEICSSDQAPKEEKEFLLPKIKGIKAIVKGDEAALNKAIADLLEAHKREALDGVYRLMCDGLICLPGIMLAQLGRENNMAVTVKSDYLLLPGA